MCFVRPGKMRHFNSFFWCLSKQKEKMYTNQSISFNIHHVLTRWGKKSDALVFKTVKLKITIPKLTWFDKKYTKVASFYWNRVYIVKSKHALSTADRASLIYFVMACQLCSIHDVSKLSLKKAPWVLRAHVASGSYDPFYSNKLI